MLATSDKTTAAQRDAAAMGVLKKREAIADRVGAVRAPAGAKAGPVGKPTVIAAGSEAAQVTRNNRNTRATAVANTLAEPGAANEGQKVFYTGNTFASKSSNGGVSWSAVALPAGPADASIACCDLDVLRVHNRDRIITSLLYTNAAQTNGVVRLFIRSDPLTAPLCTYTIDPGGTADNLLPDYPHIAVSSNFLYLSTNNITGGSWTGAQIRRFNLAQMSACGSVSFNTFTWTGAVGQRILTPVQGAKTIMYFGSNESSTQFRIFSWPESTTTITTGLRTVGTSNFVNPDCRGGVGNFDFIERSTAWSIAGFRLRGATGGGKVTFWWPVGADANHPQAHLHGVSLAVSNLAVTAQPPVWNGGTCFSYPSVASNTAGDYGLSLAFGGQAGGGGAAAQGAVAVDDADSAGIFFPSLLLTAQGTHNRSDARYGDYFTIRTNARCNQNWVATNYALLNGATTSAHVNARYIEFQSSLKPAC